MISITIESNRDPRDSLKIYRASVRDGLRELGRSWHKTKLPKHFTAPGQREYGYQKRSQQYQKRKFKKFGHRKPLVWSGVLRRTVVGSARIETGSKFVKVRMKGARALNVTNTRSKRPPIDKRKELTTLSDREANKFAVSLRDGVVKKLNTTRKRRVKTYR